jgi:glutamate N-acetyltransferase/amino-acid N-acetyltransferase
MVINTGNANAGTGADGLARARSTCIALARAGCGARAGAAVFDRRDHGAAAQSSASKPGCPRPLPTRAGPLGARGRGIMTTDTCPRRSAPGADRRQATITITGISKGAGMIRPNMATMLGFMATDACVRRADAATGRELADRSFNRITIDGDTSTNDSFVVIATNKAGTPTIDALDSADGQALRRPCSVSPSKLAQAIVRDGEGATKFITVRWKAARLARMPPGGLCHCPFAAGQDGLFCQRPQPGRILAAVGYAGIADLDQTGIDLYLDDVHVATRAAATPSTARRTASA